MTTSLKRKTLPWIGAVACALVIPPADVRAQDCRTNWQWTGAPTIKIYIHPDLAENLKKEDGTGWTDTEVQWEIERSLETLQEHVPSSVPRFEYMGFSSGVAWKDKIANAIHIVPGLDDCATGCGCFATAYLEGGSVSTGHRLALKRSGTGMLGGVDQGLENCGKKWEHWRPTFLLERHPLRGSINHETMHSYGFDHYNSGACTSILRCDTTPCSVLDGNEAHGAQYNNAYFWDWQQVQLLYGPTPATTDYRKHRESSNGTTWADWSVTSMPASASLFGAGSNSASPYMPVLIRNSGTLAPNLYRWVSTTAIWENWGTPDTGATVGRVGAADDVIGSYSAYAAWLDNESSTDTVKEIAVSKFTGLLAYTNYSFGTNVARYQGISAAFDARNSAVLLAYRNANAEVVLQTFKGTTFSSAFILTGEYATDAPAVTCGPSSITYNCVVAWSDAAYDSRETDAVLKWMHFRTSLSGTNVVITSGDVSAIVSGGYSMYGSPSVAYIGPTSSTCAFLFGWKNPGKWHTRCKGTGATAGLTAGTEVTHSWTGAPHSPSLGSGGAYYELLGVRR